MRPMAILAIDPPNILYFEPTLKTSTPCAVLRLKNVSRSRVGFKVKTTAPKSYLVKPSAGAVGPGEVAEVLVVIQNHVVSKGAVSDRFLVQAVPCDDNVEVSKDTWSKFPKAQVEDACLAVEINWERPPEPEIDYTIFNTKPAEKKSAPKEIKKQPEIEKPPPKQPEPTPATTETQDDDDFQDDEPCAVICDTGSGMVKCGFAGDDAPSVVFPSIVGRPKQPGIVAGLDPQGAYVGADAECRRGLLNIVYPICHGIVTDWNDMERIWKHTFMELKKCASQYPLLLTEAPLNPKANRERMAQIMFETFQVPALFVATQAVLALYAASLTSGIAVDSGDGTSHVVPVFQGYALPHAIMRLEVSGRDITSYLSRLLTERGHYMSTSEDREVVREMKEKLAYVALDFDKELKQYHEDNGSIQETFMLPSGKECVIGSERFRCAEALFTPSLLGREDPGLHELVFRSIGQCSVDTRKDLYANVVLCGGTTMLQNLPERMSREMTNLAPIHAKIKVHANPLRKYACWVGGSILASLPTFQGMWITKDEYDEWGTSIVHERGY